MNKKSRNQVVKRLFKQSFLDGVFHFQKAKDVVNVILCLPFPYSLAILSDYKKLVFMYLKSKTLKIQSAIGLSQEEITRIEDLFKNKYNLFYTQIEIDESLISGVIITAGDYVFDTSIKRQIRHLLSIV